MIEADKLSDDEAIVAPAVKNEEAHFEISLRPAALQDFIGQEDIKNSLTIFLGAAKKRERPLEHVLLYGNPGLGKTTLAHIIGSEMNAKVKVTSGPALERVGDLAAILTNLEPGDVLFIDEIHRMNHTIEEVLYPAMEDFALDLVVGKGPSARTLRLDLAPFTIIGATTRLSMLSAPLRDRFGTTYHLDFYTEEEISRIMARSASILGVQLAPGAAARIASRARRTPRIANRLLKRVRDYAEILNDGMVTETIADAALNLLAIDQLGLDNVDRHLLTTIIEKFSGGPVGLTTLAAATQEEMATIEEIYEPFLLQIGFLERTPRGRTVSERAYQHLGFNFPTDTT